MERPVIYYSKDEINPVIWNIFNTDPNMEMMCIIKDEDEEYWIPKFDDGSEKAKAEEEMIGKANDLKVTTSIN